MRGDGQLRLTFGFLHDSTTLARLVKKQWKYMIYNEQSLQSIYSKSCGDYALFYLKDRARGQSMNEFLNRFSKHDYVDNDHKIGQLLKKLIVNELNWQHVCRLSFRQCN